MIRVRRGDADQDGGCVECHARGRILWFEIGRDQLRLCEDCSAALIAAVHLAAKKPKVKAAKRAKPSGPDPIQVRCPVCMAGPGEHCDKSDVKMPVGPDGYHYSRVGESLRGAPVTRVRDMAPHVPARTRTPQRRRIPKPYKARK